MSIGERPIAQPQIAPVTQGSLPRRLFGDARFDVGDLLGRQGVPPRRHEAGPAHSPAAAAEATLDVIVKSRVTVPIRSPTFPDSPPVATSAGRAPPGSPGA